MSNERVADLSSEDTILLLNRATVLMHTARTVAHELNNVLQTISGSAELMDMNPAFPETLRKRLDAIGTQTARGNDLVGDIADLARANPPRQTAADVGKAIDRALRLRKFEHARGMVDVRVSLPSGPRPLVQADSLDVCLMLLNLIVNAEQAIAGVPSRWIEIGVEVRENLCRISVSDSAGVAPPDADLCAPLVTTKAADVAAGLGLAATRLLAARNGGQLDVVAKPDGLVAVLTLGVRTPAS